MPAISLAIKRYLYLANLLQSLMQEDAEVVITNHYPLRQMCYNDWLFAGLISKKSFKNVILIWQF